MMKVVQIILLSVMLLSCKGRHAYRKAVREIAAKLPEPTNMNVGSAAYSISIPDGWITEHKTMYGVDYFYLLAPKTKEDPNTSINVITESMQQLSLETYRTKTMESVKKYIPNATNFDTGSITANGIIGCWYDYEIDLEGTKSTLVSYIFPKNGVAYIITAGTQVKYARRYRPLFNAVARSIQFKD